MRCVLAGLLAVVASVISAETIEIRTVADLQSVTNNLGATYELMNDIDLSGVSFEPIGSVDGWYAFTGIFHGNGHKIVVVIGVSTLQDWSNPVVLENKTGKSWMLPTGRRANFFKVKLDK